PPRSASTLVIAAVSVVLPWSTCPIVPMLTCGLVRTYACFAMFLPLSCLQADVERPTGRPTLPRGALPALRGRVRLARQPGLRGQPSTHPRRRASRRRRTGTRGRRSPIDPAPRNGFTARATGCRTATGLSGPATAARQRDDRPGRRQCDQQ